jgi:hypothetical protein
MMTRQRKREVARLADLVREYDVLRQDLDDANAEIRYGRKVPHQIVENSALRQQKGVLAP